MVLDCYVICSFQICIDHTGLLQQVGGSRPIVNKRTETIVEHLERLIYIRVRVFGVFQEVVSDKRGEFNSRAMTEFCRKYNIRHTTTSPYHPQSNGMVERFNQTFKSMINTMVGENPQEWHRHMDKALFAYRISVHRSTKFFPFPHVQEGSSDSHRARSH